jgi:aminoglycoside 3-N-acetyltransferase
MNPRDKITVLPACHHASIATHASFKEVFIVSIAEIIQRTKTPVTVESLTAQLYTIGLAQGQTVLVHSSMSRLGWVIGGAEAVIRALLTAVGETGTIMMPTHNYSNTDPSEWQHPPVPEDWWQLIRDHTPPYNPQTTPTEGMGAVPELFRTFPGAVRSSHPAFSMTALGPNAEYLTANHSLTADIGDESPVGKLYELDGYVLLLGVEHWNNTSLHLAEFRADYPDKRTVPSGAAMMVNGKREWVFYDAFETSADDFGEVGAAFDTAHHIQVHHIHDAPVRFFKQRLVVDFAIKWMEQHRTHSRS